MQPVVRVLFSLLLCLGRGDIHTRAHKNSLAGSHSFLGWLAPAWYLRLLTHLPRPASTISPSPPLPDLQQQT